MTHSEVPSVDAKLLARYAKPGPRYTSYPTAPEFSDQFGEADYRAALARADERVSEPFSIYVHLPFCESMCTFCGCHVIIARSRDKHEAYLDHLEREVALIADALPNRRQVSQLHWGGGTPTTLNEAQLERCFRIVTKSFQLTSDAEIALEADPCVTTPKQLELLAKLGFNRLSMGVQDFTPEVQKAVNRIQPFELTRDLFQAARALPYRSINLDLIYGLPHQTVATFQRTLDQVVGLRPDRIAVFSFAYVPWMKPHQRKIDELVLPKPKEKFDLFARALATFVAAGYQQIGMDHFALPDDDLAVALAERKLHRNFMGYITMPAPEQLGLGISSIGEVGGAYVQNMKWLGEYYGAVEAGRLPVHRGIGVTEDDTLRRFVIHQLLCNFYLDIGDAEGRYRIRFADYFAAEQAELDELEKTGFIARDARSIQVTPLGRIFIRNICMVFDRYLRRPNAATARPLFSKTI